VWWELALNPQVVTAYYSSPPDLRGAEVHSVRFCRDGPTVELLAELPRFPDRPSPRWPTGANTAQAGLRFFDLREIALVGWGTSNVGELHIVRDGGIIRFEFECPTARLAGISEFFDVTGVSGYIKGNAERGAKADGGALFASRTSSSIVAAAAERVILPRILPMDKQQRKAARKQWKDAERADLVTGMPLSPEHLHRLLDYLDANLKACDHTTKLTAIFLHVEQLEKDKVLSWLGEHGGYCDCEVLANLRDLDDSLQTPKPVVRIVPRQKQNRTPRSLHTVTGWNLAGLPAPWRVANLYAASEPVCLGLGKKDGCTITIVESPMPSGDHSSDEYWSRLWYARTELPPRGALHVAHGALALPEGFEATLVRSPSWIPVYCWVVPADKSWYLEIRTELNRCAGDLPQISSLISCLAEGQA
jgi:hypothetical protein